MRDLPPPLDLIVAGESVFRLSRLRVAANIHLAMSLTPDSVDAVNHIIMDIDGMRFRVIQASYLYSRIVPSATFEQSFRVVVFKKINVIAVVQPQ